MSEIQREDGLEKVIHYKEVVVTSAQIKALVATDVDLVAAPGAGKAIELISVLLTMVPATTSPVAYTWANTDHNITVGSAAFVNDAAAQALIEASTSARYSAVLRPSATEGVLTENAALKIGASGTGEPAAGNGTLKVRVAYRVWDLTL
jgi:hypothetical protein